MRGMGASNNRWSENAGFEQGKFYGCFSWGMGEQGDFIAPRYQGRLTMRRDTSSQELIESFYPEMVSFPMICKLIINA